jgi:hypothetical protein
VATRPPFIGIAYAVRCGVAIVRVGDLEVDEDVPFQRRAWVAQRIAWVLMALFVLAAAVGLLGSGPLSHAHIDVPGLMTVEYERFARFETSETLTVRLEAAATAGETVRLSLNRDFLDSAKVETVLPPPARVEAIAGRLVYVFALAERRVPLSVTFTFDPQKIGVHEGTVGLESAETRRVTFRQLVYP